MSLLGSIDDACAISEEGLYDDFMRVKVLGIRSGETEINQNPAPFHVTPWDDTPRAVHTPSISGRFWRIMSMPVPSTSTIWDDYKNMYRWKMLFHGSLLEERLSAIIGPYKLGPGGGFIKKAKEQFDEINNPDILDELGVSFIDTPFFTVDYFREAPADAILILKLHYQGPYEDIIVSLTLDLEFVPYKE